MKISTLYATICALGALAVPSTMHAQEPAPKQKPAGESPLVEVLRAVTETYLATPQQWKETAKGLCYDGKEVGVKITDPTFGGADHHTPEVLASHIFFGLIGLGYNPHDVRTFEGHNTGVVQVEYRGRKQGEDGGLPTVIVSFHNPDSTTAYKTAWTFHTGSMELLGHFEYELPPTCQEFDRVMQERERLESIRLDRPTGRSTGDTEKR